MLRSRTLQLLIGVAAVALVVAAVVVVGNRGESLEPLSNAIVPGPTVVDLGESGDPLAPIEAAIDDATGQVDLWHFSVNPATTDVAALRAQPTTVEGVAGRSPEWFPVLTGGTAEVGRFVSAAVSGDDAVYRLQQTTAVATSRSADDIVEQITDAVDEWWGEFRTTTDDDGIERRAAAEREVADADEPASLHVSAATTEGVDDVVLVSVSATWPATGPLVPPPVESHGQDLIGLAEEQEWPMASWAQRSGWGTVWALAADELEVTWSAGGSPGSVADDVVGHLGEPRAGDAGADAANLDYGEGTVKIAAASGTTTISWRAAERWPVPGKPGPVRPSTIGTPLVDIDVDADVDAVPSGGLRPAADMVAELGQAGMIAVDGAVTSRAAVGFSSTAEDTTSATAEQLMIVDTDLSAEEVAERLTEALSGRGIDVAGGAAPSTRVGNPAVVLETAAPKRIGMPQYEIHVGESRDGDHLTAIFVRLDVTIGVPLPDPPALAEDYFTAARSAAGDMHDWTLSGWSLQYDGAGEDETLRGDLAWRTSQRGDEAGDASVAAVIDITGVEPAVIDGYHHFDVGDETWGVNVADTGAYDAVRVEWSGGSVALV